MITRIGPARRVAEDNAVEAGEDGGDSSGSDIAVLDDAFETMALSSSDEI